MAKLLRIKKIDEKEGPSESFVTRSIIEERIAKLETRKGLELTASFLAKEITKEEFEAELKNIKL
jgi:hypothetical protein